MTGIVKRGDLTIFLSYIADGDGYRENGSDSKQPALVIAHKGAGVNKAWIIPMSDAWRYCRPDGYPTDYCYLRTIDIGEHLGIGSTISARRQIFLALADFIQELMEMPEYDMVRADRGRNETRVEGELKFMIEGELISEREMKA